MASALIRAGTPHRMTENDRPAQDKAPAPQRQAASAAGAAPDSALGDAPIGGAGDGRGAGPGSAPRAGSGATVAAAPRGRPRDRAVNAAFRAVLALALALPYRWRVPLVGWVFARLVAPVAGFRRRIRANLAHVCPDLPEAEVARLCRAVPDNIGRGLIETYSAKGLTHWSTRHPIEGPGLEALRAARADGRPVILVTGHFGNFNAARAALVAEGFPVAALYRPMTNPFFNPHYEAAMHAVSRPLFSRDKRGMAAMLRFLREGGMVGILIDQRMAHGKALRFFGRPAHTALSAAELALRLDAPAVPVYAIRQPDGLSFRVVVEAPVPPDTPEAMTQALNDSLEARVRAHMDQWFWIHRRWAAPNPVHVPAHLREETAAIYRDAGQ